MLYIGFRLQNLACFFACLSLPLSVVNGQNAYLVPKVDSIKDQILEVCVIRSSNLLQKSPALSVIPIQIITNADIERSGARDVAELLSRRGGMNVQTDNILGASLSFQGLSGENVKILVNDVPITGRQSGNIDLSQFNLSNVEQIEIIEGPASVLYGTNAIGGVINIITKQTVTGKKHQFSAKYYGETANHHNVNVSIGGALGSKHGFLMDVSRNAFLGWSPDAKLGENRYSQWKPRIQLATNGTYNYNHNGWRIGATYSYFEEFMLSRGKPIAPYNEQAFDDEFNTKRSTQSLQLNKKLDKSWSLRFTFSHNDFNRIKNTYFRNLTTLDKRLAQGDDVQDTTRFSLINARGMLMRKEQANFNMEIGYDINVETGAGMRLKGKKQQISDYAAFWGGEWMVLKGNEDGVGSLKIRPALRVAYNTNYAAPITPSFNLKYNWEKNWSLRASYARGFRSPSLKELYFYFVDINHNIQGNENLRAERSHSFNASVFGTTLLSDKNIIKFEINAFSNAIVNQIDLALIRAVDNGVPEYGYINIGRVRTQGGRLDVNWRNNRFLMSVSGNFLHKITFLSQQPLVANMFDVRTTLAFDIEKDKHTIQFTSKHTSQQQGFWVNENRQVVPTFIAPYTIADLTWLSNFKSKSRSFQINTGVKNLFDVKNIAAQLAGGGHTGGGDFASVATGKTLFLGITIGL
jgi:outer membrane receptor for ferrienterochelin and colicins